jgi:amidase
VSGWREYSSYDGLGLAELIQRGEVSREEVLEEAIERLERVNPRINAVIHQRLDKARAACAQADGPFAGVPFLVKDLLQTFAGEPTSSGSRFFDGWRATADSELACRYLRAGLVVLGRTNTPELGLLPVTEPTRFGASNNPWNLDRSTGGSSGGAAAAVAAGIVPLAHAGDGGGSIRIPAACCGLFGLKPTRGRTPVGPDASERWNGFTQEHIVSRSVRDSAAVLDATLGDEPGAPYVAPPPARPYLEEIEREVGTLRIALVTEPAMPCEVDRDCLHAARDAGELCESLGHEVVEVAPRHDSAKLAVDFLTVIAGQTAAEILEAERTVGRRATTDDFETETWLTYLFGRQLRASDYAMAMRDLQTETRRLAGLFSAYDVILTPTLGRVPVRHGTLHPKGAERAAHRAIVRGRLGPALRLPGVIEKAAARAFTVAAYTPVANFTGQPSMSVPLWWNAEGLPVGAMFTGRFGDEATLFRLAAQLEKARPWFDRKPPIHSDPP